MAVLCYPWHAFCSCSVSGALGFVGFLALTLSGAVKAAFYCAWFQAERWGGNNVGAVPCFPWYVYCGSSVPGALGFVGFLTLTLCR